jgi:Ca2+-binding EF-hand superfamily protein
MGNGNSRIVSYEDAVELLTLPELTLLRKAWAQLCGNVWAEGEMPQGESLEEVQIMRGHFNRTVLGGRFPKAMEERLFYAFRSEGREILTFKDWISAFTLLKKGTPEQRVGFLYRMCDHADQGKVDLPNVMAVFNSTENAHNKKSKAQRVRRLVDELFESFQPKPTKVLLGEQPNVPLKVFQEWVLAHREDTLLISWLFGDPATNLLREPLAGGGGDTASEPAAAARQPQPQPGGARGGGGGGSCALTVVGGGGSAAPDDAGEAGVGLGDLGGRAGGGGDTAAGGGGGAGVGAGGAGAGARTIDGQMAKETHFNAMEIGSLYALYRQVLSESPTGRVDHPTFVRLFCPPLRESLAQLLFSAFDKRGNGEIDVFEIICGLSACCRGSIADSLGFCLSLKAEGGGGVVGGCGGAGGAETQHTRAELFSIVKSFIRLTDTLAVAPTPASSHSGACGDDDDDVAAAAAAEVEADEAAAVEEERRAELVEELRAQLGELEAEAADLRLAVADGEEELREARASSAEAVAAASSAEKQRERATAELRATKEKAQMLMERAVVEVKQKRADATAAKAELAKLEAATLAADESVDAQVSQNGQLLSCRGRSLPANASGFVTHRDSISSRFDCAGGGAVRRDGGAAGGGGGGAQGVGGEAGGGAAGRGRCDAGEAGGGGGAGSGERGLHAAAAGEGHDRGTTSGT